MTVYCLQLLAMSRIQWIRVRGKYQNLLLWSPMTKDCGFPPLYGTSAAQASPAGNKVLEVDGGRSSRSLKLALILRIILDLRCLGSDAFEVRVVRRVAPLMCGRE